MNWHPVDQIDRTAKILIDSGKAADHDDARRYLQGLVLQIAVGPEIAADPAGQAALATAVNAGRRAFLGGVRVHLDTDPVLGIGWTTGHTATEVTRRYGGTVTDRLTADHPTLVIGSPRTPVPGRPVVHLHWAGWTASVTLSAESGLTGTTGITPAGVLAAGLGVAETFQHQLGAALPGRRDIGLSLWRPDLPWTNSEAVGPALHYLPRELWLLGLGHLGQAYAWTLGLLPYDQPDHVQVGLLDYDVAVGGNTSTQLLTRNQDVNRKKTRITATAFEELGFGTRIVERAFDNMFRPALHGLAARNEPTIALGGFDDITPRRNLGSARFSRVVDAGLGTGPGEYLDIVLHTFPATRNPQDAFTADPRTRTNRLPDAYEAEIKRQVDAGQEPGIARCGMLDVAGVTVGAAFVGTVASTLVIADLLRALHNGAAYSVVSIDLRTPTGVLVAANPNPEAAVPPPFTPAKITAA